VSDISLLVVIGANLATIFSVLFALLKISAEFGSMRAQSGYNVKRLDKHEKRFEKHDSRISEMEKVVF